MHRISVRVLAISGSALAATAVGIACCSVSPSGNAVLFGDQTNIIVWNAQTHTEHFIRNASFQTTAKDFGFIAPTPSKPELSEASSEAFETLAALKPATKSRSSGGEPTASAPPAAAKVEVVQEADVAGYHATTLLANDAKALGAWMKQNGYATTPDVEKWTKFYLAKDWYLTAFRVINKSDRASTGTVRISFSTSRPFNPYYVPANNINPTSKGVLQLFFVSTGDYRATIGEREPWIRPDWHATIHPRVSDYLAKELHLEPSDIPVNAQVETFIDRDFPRVASDDIYFHEAHFYTDPRPLEAGALFVLAGLGLSWLVGRRSRRI